MAKFSIGAVVQLNSGSAEMTVTENRSDGCVVVEWTDKNDAPQKITVPEECCFLNSEE